MKILLLFAALTAGAAETNLFNKLNFGGKASDYDRPRNLYIGGGNGLWPSNIVIATNYTGTIQIGTNYFKVGEITK